MGCGCSGWERRHWFRQMYGCINAGHKSLLKNDISHNIFFFLNFILGRNRQHPTLEVTRKTVYGVKSAVVLVSNRVQKCCYCSVHVCMFVCHGTKGTNWGSDTTCVFLEWKKGGFYLEDSTVVRKYGIYFVGTSHIKKSIRPSRFLGEAGT